jgi:hypothetical protein
MVSEGTEKIVEKLPKCDFCNNKARYDGRVKGQTGWANMCAIHFGMYGVGLGVGYKPNRVDERIKLIQAKIDHGNVSQSKLAELEKSLKTDLMDLFQYQNLQAAAHAQGALTTEEAERIYRLLGGEAPSEAKWDKLSIAEKVTVTQVMSELLDAKLKNVKRSSPPAKSSRKRGKSGGPGGIRGMRG